MLPKPVIYQTRCKTSDKWEGQTTAHTAGALGSHYIPVADGILLCDFID